MTTRDYIQLGLFLTILFATAKPLGTYMDRVYDGEGVFLSRVFGPIQRWIYTMLRVHPNEY